ncbi:MAG: hypothetical protein AABM30_03315 [Actinomycetota bacterium]
MDAAVQSKSRGAVERPRRFCNVERRARPSGCCLELRNPPDRPDLATYSQLEQLALGREPTWNSPDITTNNTLPWGPWPPGVEVRVRNLSATASAVNALVHLARSPFGIGLDHVPQSSKVLTLAPSEERWISFPLPAPVPGADPNMSVVATIEHPSDEIRGNNRGEQAVAGGTTTDVGRTPVIRFPLRNPDPVAQEITLAVLTNALGATVAPAAHAFAGYEQIQASLTLHVPPGLHGGGGGGAPLHETTILARGPAGEVIGGVTYLLWVDD